MGTYCTYPSPQQPVLSLLTCFSPAERPLHVDVSLGWRIVPVCLYMSSVFCGPRVKLKWGLDQCVSSGYVILLGLSRRPLTRLSAQRHGSLV